MTACARMFKLLDELLAEKKSLDRIGAEMCDSVMNPRLKAIRLIKQHKGEAYLIENAEWLDYRDENLHGNQHTANKNVGEQKDTDPEQKENEPEPETLIKPPKSQQAGAKSNEELEAEKERQERLYGKPVPGIDIHLSYWKTHLCPIP